MLSSAGAEFTAVPLPHLPLDLPATSLGKSVCPGFGVPKPAFISQCLVSSLAVIRKCFGFPTALLLFFHFSQEERAMVPIGPATPHPAFRTQSGKQEKMRKGKSVL